MNRKLILHDVKDCLPNRSEWNLS